MVICKETLTLTLIDKCIETLRNGDIDIYTKIARVTGNLEAIREMTRKLEDPYKK